MCAAADASNAHADPYTVLGVSRTASHQQVRRAYKTLCLRWHPDKHPAGASRRAAERQFKAISVAYAAVSERHSKRTASDVRERSCGTSSSPPRSRNHYAPGAHFEDDAAFFFHDVFDSDDDDDDYENQSANMSFRSATRHEDLVLPLALTLSEFASGCTKQHRVHADDAGSSNAKLLRVVVKPGYRPGDRIRFRNVRADGGDVVFTLTQSNAAPWTHAKLHGDDVHITQRIALVDALTGGRISVCTPRGSKLLRVLPVITPGATRVVPACGLPCRSDPSEFGDVVVRFDVVFPNKVDDASRVRLREVFSRMEQSGMRRCSSVFSARAFRRQEQHTQQKRACSYCEREEQPQPQPQPPPPPPPPPPRASAQAQAARQETAAGREAALGRRGGARRETRGGGTPQPRLRTMLVKSSSKLAAVFR